MRLIESVLRSTGQAANRWRRCFIKRVPELLLMVPDKATFRDLSRYSDYDEKSFSRGFGRAFDWVLFNREAICQVVASNHKQALVLDTSFIRKNGRCTYTHLENGQTLTKFTPLYKTLCNHGTISQQIA
jgi:hypothetical protein